MKFKSPFIHRLEIFDPPPRAADLLWIHDLFAATASYMKAGPTVNQPKSNGKKNKGKRREKSNGNHGREDIRATSSFPRRTNP